MSAATLEPNPFVSREVAEADLPDEVQAILADPGKVKKLLALINPNVKRRLISASKVPDFPLAELPARVEKMIAHMRAQGAVKSEAEWREYAWQNEVRQHLKGSQLPERFWTPLKKWHPKQKAVFDACESRLTGMGAIMALVGPRGVGKTSIAAQLILRRAMDETIPIPMHRRPPYRKALSLVSKLKPIYSDFGSIQGDTLRMYMQDFCKVHPFAVIDEVGEALDMKVWDRLVTDILDRRYSHRNDTILISNQTFDDFMQRTNPSTLSRLQEHGEIIVCDWPSFRAKPAFSVVHREAS